MVLIDTVHMTIIQPRLEFPSPYGDYGSYQYRVLDEYIDSWYGFPSPYGDYGSYLYRPVQKARGCKKCFRPLTGIMVLIKMMTLEQQLELEKSFRPLTGIRVLISQIRSPIFFSPLCFRPLTGIMVLIMPEERLRFYVEMLSFRPLTGIMVLICTLYRWLYEAFEMAFCGADHIFSSFFVFYKKMIFKKIVWA